MFKVAEIHPKSLRKIQYTVFNKQISSILYLVSISSRIIGNIEFFMSKRNSLCPHFNKILESLNIKCVHYMFTYVYRIFKYMNFKHVVEKYVIQIAILKLWTYTRIIFLIIILCFCFNQNDFVCIF